MLRVQNALVPVKELLVYKDYFDRMDEGGCGQGASPKPGRALPQVIATSLGQMRWTCSWLSGATATIV